MGEQIRKEADWLLISTIRVAIDVWIEFKNQTGNIK